jgi:parvulin-like peptidyl-prolyl isomerase
MFHAAHILCAVNEKQSEEQALAAIQAAEAELARGDDFGTVVERHSSCEGNGDLGFFPSGKMVEEFEKAIRELQPGQRSGIFSTPFGYHIAELRARKSGGGSPFEDVRLDIQRVLTAMREHQAVLQGIAKLRAAAIVKRLPDSVDGVGSAHA